MATPNLVASVDHEILERLNILTDERGVELDAIVNEALKHYLCGRVPTGISLDEGMHSVKADVHVSVK